MGLTQRARYTEAGKIEIFDRDRRLSRETVRYIMSAVRNYRNSTQNPPKLAILRSKLEKKFPEKIPHPLTLLHTRLRCIGSRRLRRLDIPAFGARTISH